MGKEQCVKFDQESLVSSKLSKSNVGGGVCLGYSMEFIKYLHRNGTSENIVRAFVEKEGEGLEESLLDIGEKSIKTHYSENGGSLLDLWGHAKSLKELGYKVTVGENNLGGPKAIVNAIENENRFAFHLLYFSVHKDGKESGWHVVALKGYGWTGYFERVYFAMDPNQGIWKITGSDALYSWVWSDITSVYAIFNLHVVTISK